MHCVRKLADKYVNQHAVRKRDVVPTVSGRGQYRKWLPDALLRASQLDCTDLGDTATDITCIGPNGMYNRCCVALLRAFHFTRSMRHAAFSFCSLPRFGWPTLSALEESVDLADRSITSMSLRSVGYWMRGSGGFVAKAPMDQIKQIVG